MKKSEITKSNILETATLEFAEKGISGARIDEIASLAKANKRMIYEYFGSKEGLYKEVLNHVYAKIAQRELQFAYDCTDCVASIKALIKDYFDFLYANPTFVKLVLWENLNKAQYIKDTKAFMLKDPGIKAAGNILKQGIQSGVFKKDIDVYQTIVSLNAFSFSYFANIYTMSSIMQRDMFNREEIDARIAYVSDIILKDIQA